MSALPSESVILKTSDISWKLFIAGYGIIVLVHFLFDEVFRPMRGVDLLEKILWYFTFGATYLLIPGLLVFVMWLFPRVRSETPKKTILVFGSLIMVFSLLVNALRYVSR